MAGAACTVTTSSDDDAGDLFADSGTGGDTSTGDTGTTDSEATCSARDGVYVDSGPDPQTFGSADCDNCMDQNCCDSVGACFEDPTGECQEFEDCLTSTLDAGDDGGFAQTCADSYPNGADLHNGWATCLQTSCNTQCQ
ncbi:MAG: hypothetical protein ACRELY_31665 [Polyangiaceae bacterium]